MFQARVKSTFSGGKWLEQLREIYRELRQG
jgi:hypothetical protein